MTTALFCLCRFRKFLLYMGMPVSAAKDVKINSLCKTISEFALDYRTTRDRILQQRKRVQDKRERNKTRGKLWAAAAPESPGAAAVAATPSSEQRRHQELSRLLRDGAGNGDAETAAANWRGTLRRTRPAPAAEMENGNGAAKHSKRLVGHGCKAWLQGDQPDRSSSLRAFMLGVIPAYCGLCIMIRHGQRSG